MKRREAFEKDLEAALKAVREAHSAAAELYIDRVYTGFGPATTEDELKLQEIANNLQSAVEAIDRILGQRDELMGPNGFDS